MLPPRCLWARVLRQGAPVWPHAGKHSVESTAFAAPLAALSFSPTPRMGETSPLNSLHYAPARVAAENRSPRAALLQQSSRVNYCFPSPP